MNKILVKNYCKINCYRHIFNSMINEDSVNKILRKKLNLMD